MHGRTILAAWLLALGCQPAAAVDVNVTGAAATAGTLKLAARARLSDGALAAQVRLDGYMLAAAWLRPSRVETQARLKAGVLFDLDKVRQHARARDDRALADAAAALGEWVQSLPVTGRQVALLDPRAIEVTAAQNWPLASGDTLYYPTRPTTVRLLGAVLRPCELRHAPLQDARDYLKACPVSTARDKDWIYVIQPDGRVSRQGIALWNPARAMPLAPGAVIYVPLAEGDVHGVAPDLNRELADFLATQTLDTLGVHP